MEFILSVLSGLFIAVVIGTALAFGFMILVWALVFAIVLALGLYVRETVRRWLFVHRAEMPEHKPPQIIDGEYKDLTD